MKRSTLDDIAIPSSSTPSAGPFRAKGLIYTNARDFYDLKVPGGMKAVYASIASQAVRRFLDQPFVSSGWYDIFPIDEMSAAAAKLRGQPHVKHVRENAAWAAVRDLHGAYKVLLEVAGPEQLVKRLPKLSMHYFDFGAADGRLVKAQTFEGSRTGIPAALANWFTWAFEGFMPVALTLAGASDVRVQSAAPKPDGEIKGVATVQIKFEITWR